MKKIITFILAILLLGGSGAWAFPPMMAGGDDTLSSYTVATLPTGSTGLMVYVTDGASSSDCTTGSGANKVVCIYTGSAWAAAGSAGGVPTSITVADTTDTSTWVLLTQDQTGDIAPKTDGGIAYNASTGVLTATGLAGALNGTVGAGTPAAGAFTTIGATGKVTTAASAAVAGAGLIVPHGTAPNTPVNGDIWTTTGGLYAYIDGVTTGPFATAAGANPPFSAVTAGTNVAALVVGTGGTLGVSGTGTIDATTLLGNTWAAPEPIGSGTPSTGAFTTFSAGSGAMTVDALGNVTALSFTTSASADPTITLTDSDTGAAGTAKIYGISAGSQDVIMYLGVEIAGSTTNFVEIDGVSETIDVLYPLVVTGSYISLGADPADAGAIRLANGAAIVWEDATEASITHVDNTGWLINSTHQLQFGDSGTYVNQSADGVLNVASDTELKFLINDEDIKLTKTGSNGITIGTNTGTLAITSAIAFNVPVQATEVDGHTDQTALTAAQVSGTIIYNTGQGAADVFLLLPTAAAGYSFVATVGTAQSNHFGVEAGANDKIYLIASDGTVAAGDNAAGVVMTAAQVGQAFACWTFKTDAYDWMCKAISIGTSTFAAHAHSTP